MGLLGIALAGGLVLMLVAVWPELSLLGIAVFIEEELINGGHDTAEVSSVVKTGSSLFNVYYLGFRLAVLLAFLCSFVVLFRRGTRVFSSAAVVPILLVVWTIWLGTYQGLSLRAAFGASAPWFIIGCSVICGRSIMLSVQRRKACVRLIFCGVVFKAIVGIFVVASGKGLRDAGSPLTIVYYDSATSYLAVAVAIGSVLGLRQRAKIWCLIAACLLVVAESMRRNVIAAGFVELLVSTAATTKYRRPRVVLAVCGIALVVVSTAYLAPGLIHGKTKLVQSSFETLLGSGADASTVSHLSDISVAWQVVQTSPLTGVGLFAPPQLGLVVSTSANLYVHNEYLQTWLRFGLGGVVLLCALLIAALIRAIIVLRSGTKDLLTSIACVYCVGLPAPLMFFAHLTSDVRWQILTGFFVAIVWRKKGDSFAGAEHTQAFFEQEHVLETPGLTGRASQLLALPPTISLSQQRRIGLRLYAPPLAEVDPDASSLLTHSPENRR